MIKMVPSFSEPQAIYIHLRCVFDVLVFYQHTSCLVEIWSIDG